MKAFIERIEMFPEKRKDGSWIKKIVFNFPVPVDGEEVKELPLETETTVEAVILLSRETNPRTVEVGMEAETGEGKRVNYTGKA
ncbi:MAG: recombinase family protein, partial [Oscillospiraceae bacterium]|nr:recombinase family protein [Oscillospiraceae bacterium]